VVDGNETVECRSCGFANCSLGLVQIRFDDDQAKLRVLLDADPLVAPCGNCGELVASISAVAFVDSENRVAACLAADARGVALAEEVRRGASGWSFSLYRRPEELATVIHAHLVSLASKGSALAAGLFKAARQESGGQVRKLVFGESAPIPSRRMLSALAMLGGDSKMMAETVAPFIAARHSFQSLIARTDATQALDALVPPLLVSGRIGFLVGFGMPLGATQLTLPGLSEPNTSLPAEVGIAPVLAAAWASDRTGATFERPGPAVWAECVVRWLDQHPDAAAALGPPEFLRRTVDNVSIVNFTVLKMLEHPTRLEFIDMVERLGLFGGIDFAAHLEQTFGTAPGAP
jgi:hypothetical protein